MKVRIHHIFLISIFLFSILIAETPDKWEGYWEKPLIQVGEETITKQPGLYKSSALVWIRIYQKGISRQDLPSCVFHPSCSRFVFGCIERYGVMKGVLLAGDRLMRCNPFAYLYYVFDGEKFIDHVDRYNLK